MKTLTTIITAISLMVCASPAHANDAKKLERAAARINAQSNTPEGEIKVLTKISDETGVPVAMLQTQRSQTKLGYGELLIANSLASASGKTFDEIAALKASGQGWGKIAKTYDLKLGKIVSQAHHADEAISGGEIKDKKKGKDRDNDFFTDDHNGAGKMRSLDHGRGADFGQIQGNASHGNSQGHGLGKGKGP